MECIFREYFLTFTWNVFYDAASLMRLRRASGSIFSWETFLDLPCMNSRISYLGLTSLVFSFLSEKNLPLNLLDIETVHLDSFN